MDSLINTEIIGNPMNWLLVVVILIFVTYATYVLWTNIDTLTPTLPRAA